MKKILILSAFLLGLLNLCYAQSYVFMENYSADESYAPELLSCAINSDNSIGNCQSAYKFAMSYGLVSSPIVVNQHLIFSYRDPNSAGTKQIFANCPILSNGLLGECVETDFSLFDGYSAYGFIAGYQQPSETSIDKLELSDTEPKNIEIA